MTGFLLTAKQKLMLCINKRLYRTDRAHRSHRNTGQRRAYRTDRTFRSRRNNRSYRTDRADWAYRTFRRTHWTDWA